jgi:putative RNA 2'-phosphotransferase
MDEARKIRLSKFLSKILRHDPKLVGLTLGEGGWVMVDDLISGCIKKGMSFSRAELDEIVHTSDKQRFAFDETGIMIRANQGHSIEVDLRLEPTTPPDVLYHGTATRFWASIQAHGLLRMARHHVHLSADIETARKVGVRHGKLLVLRVDSAAMARDGYSFYQSENGVWLTDRVPPQYLTII